MNTGLLVWSVALFALLVSIVVLLFGVAMLALFFFGIVEPMLALFGAALFLSGVAGFYYLYRWFTAEV